MLKGDMSSEGKLGRDSGEGRVVGEKVLNG